MIKKILKWSSLLVVSGILLLALLLVTALYWPLQQLPTPNVTTHLILQNVSIVDLEAGKVHPKQHLLIQNGKIVDIVATLEPSKLAEKPKVLDMAGKYVIPGLWDMHVHSLRLFPHLQAPLYIASGVLRIRQKQWQQDVDSEVKYDSSKAGRKAVMDFYRKGLQLTGQAHRAGVKILAGRVKKGCSKKAVGEVYTPPLRVTKRA